MDRWGAPMKPPATPAVAAVTDCVQRPDRRRDRSQTLPAEAPRRNRECVYTTALRPENAALVGTDAKKRCALGCARSSRQAMAALVATGLQHGTSRAGAHPVAKAVLLGTATVIWLVGALHAALLEMRTTAHRYSLATPGRRGLYENNDDRTGHRKRPKRDKLCQTTTAAGQLATEVPPTWYLPWSATLSCVADTRRSGTRQQTASVLSLILSTFCGYQCGHLLDVGDE